MSSVYMLDCTFRDGGYYNAWDFSESIIREYLVAMKGAQVGVVELGFRMLSTDGFKGACAFSTDEFLRGLDIPEGLVVAVMVNAGDLLAGPEMEAALDTLFPCGSARSPVDLVRIACHVHEFAAALPAAQ